MCRQWRASMQARPRRVSYWPRDFTFGVLCHVLAHAAVTQLFMRAGIAPVVTQEAVQVQTVVGLVASGLGVALVPSVNAPHSKNRVDFRPLRDSPQAPGIGIAIAYKTAGELAVSVRFRELVGQLADKRPGTASLRVVGPAPT